MNKNIPKTYLIDANEQILGRLATKVTDLLRGKGKVTFVPNFDMGDNVVVINANGIKLTGKKTEDKVYYHHSGYPGGIKSKTVREMGLEAMLKTAVYGMLPKNKLRDKFIKKLKMFADDSYQAREGDIKLDI